MGRGAKALLVLAIVGVVGAGVALASSGSKSPSTPSAAAAATAKMTDAELIGQRLVAGYVGTTPPKAVLSAARAGRIGGVILFANNIGSPSQARAALRKLQAAAKAGGNPPLLTTVDQEGGIVQRLPTLPPTKSPAQIGKSANPAATGLAQGRATGRALRRYGFNVNFAPVVDVPRVASSFLGNRAYSHIAAVVADAGCAFAGGIQQGGVSATFKHFPGLGRAGADTDFSDVTINATQSQVESDWAAYRKCPGIPAFTMIASASYPKLGINQPASLVKKTYSLLASTGFKGLTITDAFETPQFTDRPDAARTAMLAGADVVLYGEAWPKAMAARRRLVADVAAGRLTRAQLQPAAERIVALKLR